jgi:uncharacterized membrane protein YkvA (DUF1232 family)
MNDVPRQKLAEILAQYSNTIAKDPKRLKQLLDYVTDNEYPTEVNLLIDALEEGVFVELAVAHKPVPQTVLIPRITAEIQAHLGWTQEAATWAVEAWANAVSHSTPNKDLGEATSASSAPPKSEPKPPVVENFTTPPSKTATLDSWSISRFPVYLFKQTRLSWWLLLDGRVSILLKMIPIIATAYIISPIALIVDLIPFAGLLANFAVYMLALALFNYMAPAHVVKEHMESIEAKDVARRAKAAQQSTDSDKTKY